MRSRHDHHAPPCHRAGRENAGWSGRRQTPSGRGQGLGAAGPCPGAPCGCREGARVAGLPPPPPPAPPPHQQHNTGHGGRREGGQGGSAAATSGRGRAGHGRSGPRPGEGRRAAGRAERGPTRQAAEPGNVLGKTGKRAWPRDLARLPFDQRRLGAGSGGGELAAHAGRLPSPAVPPRWSGATAHAAVKNRAGREESGLSCLSIFDFCIATLSCESKSLSNCKCQGGPAASGGGAGTTAAPGRLPPVRVRGATATPVPGDPARPGGPPALQFPAKCPEPQRTASD